MASRLRTCTGTKFSSWNPSGAAPVPRDLMPSSSFCRRCTHMYTHTDSSKNDNKIIFFNLVTQRNDTNWSINIFKREHSSFLLESGTKISKT